MLAYQRGDSSAFETVYSRHKSSLFAFLVRSGAHPDSVEEIFQEAWSSIIRRIEHYEPKAKFKTYLYQVAHNKLIDYWRRRKHESDEEFDPDLHTAADSGSLSAPEHSALHAEILNLVAELPIEQRHALMLQEQGFSLAEIADITNSGDETVKSRLRYARKALRATATATPTATDRTAGVKT